MEEWDLRVAKKAMWDKYRKFFMAKVISYITSLVLSLSLMLACGLLSLSLSLSHVGLELRYSPCPWHW